MARDTDQMCHRPTKGDPMNWRCSSETGDGDAAVTAAAGCIAVAGGGTVVAAYATCLS